MKFSSNVIVIGNRGNLRNPRLKQLEALARVTYLDPIYLENNDQLCRLVDQEVAELSLGRPLLLGEAGCALAHRLATETAQSMLNRGSEGGVASLWCLVLEDDAEGHLSKFSQVLDQLENLEKKDPSLINFFSLDGTELQTTSHLSSFSNQNPVLKRQHYWRGITSSYAINLAAAELLSSSFPPRLSFVADWPPNYHHVKFYSSNLSLTQSEVPSIIGSRGKFSAPERLRLYVRQIANLSFLGSHYKISRRAVLKILIYYPIARDLDSLIRRFRTGAKHRAR
jgi:GR25 family glycosyltransferase involved in LPS biosynthesis